MVKLFEWDDSKAESNWLKHGISFEHAINAFDDVFAVGFIDNRQDYGEERLIWIGMAADELLLIVYTVRDKATRIISARRANKYERQIYFDSQ